MVARPYKSNQSLKLISFYYSFQLVLLAILSFRLPKVPSELCFIGNHLGVSIMVEGKKRSKAFSKAIVYGKRNTKGDKGKEFPDHNRGKVNKALTNLIEKAQNEFEKFDEEENYPEA